MLGLTFFVMTNVYGELDSFDFRRQYPSPCDAGAFYDVSVPDRQSTDLHSETYSGLADGPEDDQTWAVVAPFMPGYFFEVLFQSEADAREALPDMIERVKLRKSNAPMDLNGALLMRETIDGSCGRLRGQS